MADLDNFFAKKDKKKVKGRKYDNLDDIAKRLTDCEKKLEKELIKVEPAKKTLDEVLSTSQAPAGEETVVEQKEKVEEEWNDFKDDSQKDLSNLKISRLQMEDDEDGTGGYGSGEDDGGLGEENVSGTGVWNKVMENVESEATAEPEVVPSNDTSSKVKGSYLPPQLRKMAASPLPKGGSSRKPKVAPDITNDMAFPSLAAAQSGKPLPAWGRMRDANRDDMRGFDSVRHGASPSNKLDNGPPKLSTTNRFDALSDQS